MEFNKNFSRPRGEPSFRVLIQNRPNALSQRGGDTVLLEHLARGLVRKGHLAELDLEGRLDPKEFDLVHLCNFATPQLTEKYARRAHAAGVPYVVTTLYEDWPNFYNQMHNFFFGLKAYTDAGQPVEKWREIEQAARDIEACNFIDNSWTAKHASALIVTGRYEARCLERDYPEHGPISTVHLGHEVTAEDDGGELFRSATGVSDFILCVGRLESRKNQLMLLKALEESDLPLVFATGGFTYQPEYEEACRRFSRRGKTIFLGRLEPEMLASAYAASRVHALPSWFELPGLVSLEAAQYGTNIVLGERGTASDYFGERAFYCAPDDSRSIKNAVLAAYYSPRNNALAEHVAQFSWSHTVGETLAIYRKILGDSKSVASLNEKDAYSASLSQLETEARTAQTLVGQIPQVLGQEVAEDADLEGCEQALSEADTLFKSGYLDAAFEKYHLASQLCAQSARAQRGMGVTELTRENYPQASVYFKRALKCDPEDLKSLLGLGAVDWAEGRREEAFELYLKAAELDSRNPSSILYLVSAAYELERYRDLEQALRRFLIHDRGNLSVQYCLAGCYFKQKKYSLATAMLENMLKASPAHAQALELREEISRLASLKDSEARSETVREELAKPVFADMPDEIEDPQVFHRLYRRAHSIAAKLRLLEEAKKRKEYERVIEYVGEVAESSDASSEEKALAAILRAEAHGCLGELSLGSKAFLAIPDTSAYRYRALAGRGAIAAASGDWVQAKDLFARAIRLQPNYDVALAGLGICHENLGQKEEAWEIYQQALAVNAENLQALHAINHLGYALGRLTESEFALSNYLDIKPVDLPLVYSYAGCLYAQGKRVEALEQCRKILIFEPQHEMALELKERIESEQRQELPRAAEGGR